MSWNSFLLSFFLKWWAVKKRGLTTQKPNLWIILCALLYHTFLKKAQVLGMVVSPTCCCPGCAGGFGNSWWWASWFFFWGWQREVRTALAGVGWGRGAHPCGCSSQHCQPGDSHLQEVPGGCSLAQTVGCADGWVHSLWDGTSSSVSSLVIDGVINKVKKMWCIRSHSEGTSWHI